MWDSRTAANRIQGWFGKLFHEPVRGCLRDGYDTGHLIDSIAQNKAKAAIPPRSCWKTQRDYDKQRYKERNRVERFFNKLKRFRRVATRYDKLPDNFIGFVKSAAIAIWLKELNGHDSLAGDGLTGCNNVRARRRVSPSCRHGRQ
mgnify:CR=1 FL=1